MTRGPCGVSDCALEAGPGCWREERREHLRRSGPLRPGYVRRRRTVARRGRWPVGHVAGLEWRRLLFAAWGRGWGVEWLPEVLLLLLWLLLVWSWILGQPA
jgi:hypothetical protein